MFAVYASHPDPGRPLGSLVVGEQPNRITTCPADGGKARRGRKVKGLSEKSLATVETPRPNPERARPEPTPDQHFSTLYAIVDALDPCCFRLLGPSVAYHVHVALSENLRVITDRAFLDGFDWWRHRGSLQ